MVGFWGNLGWVHDREGHRGRPYWPGGQSGITLDPGVDLAYVSKDLALDAYQKAGVELPEQKLNSLGVWDLKGKKAKACLKNNPSLLRIRITQAEARAVFPIVASPYWRNIRRRFQAVLARDLPPVPSCVHTVMLSLAYNRGPGNKALGVLCDPLMRYDWAALAKAVGGMQQYHLLPGIRRRRRMEAQLIMEFCRKNEH